MGLTKSELFSAYQNKLAAMAKVLAHPARIAIIEYLLKENACINNDLVHELGLAQASVSQHLRELKQAGIVKGSIEGISMSYCIDKETWKTFQREFNDLFDRFSGSSPFEYC